VRRWQPQPPSLLPPLLPSGRRRVVSIWGRRSSSGANRWQWRSRRPSLSSWYSAVTARCYYNSSSRAPRRQPSAPPPLFPPPPLEHCEGGREALGRVCPHATSAPTVSLPFLWMQVGMQVGTQWCFFRDASRDAPWGLTRTVAGRDASGYPMVFFVSWLITIACHSSSFPPQS
jgi:hypothetical protein